MNPSEQLMEELRNESLLHYYYRSLGLFDTLVLLFLAGAAFLITALIVFKGKGPTVGPGLVLTAPLAAYYGLYSAISAMISVYRVVELSGTTPDPDLLIGSFGSVYVSFYIGMLLSMPTFLLAVVGATVRSLTYQEPKQRYLAEPTE